MEHRGFCQRLLCLRTGDRGYCKRDNRMWQLQFGSKKFNLKMEDTREGGYLPNVIMLI